MATVRNFTCQRNMKYYLMEMVYKMLFTSCKYGSCTPFFVLLDTRLNASSSDTLSNVVLDWMCQVFLIVTFGTGDKIMNCFEDDRLIHWFKDDLIANCTL